MICNRSFPFRSVPFRSVPFRSVPFPRELAISCISGLENRTIRFLLYAHAWMSLLLERAARTEESTLERNNSIPVRTGIKTDRPAQLLHFRMNNLFFCLPEIRRKMGRNNCTP